MDTFATPTRRSKRNTEALEPGFSFSPAAKRSQVALVDQDMTMYTMGQTIFANSLTIIEYLQQIGIFAKTNVCDTHNCPMVLKPKHSIRDGWFWVCTTANCKKEKSVRHSSFFAKSNLNLHQLMIIIYHWFYRMQQKKAAHEAQITDFTRTAGSVTTINW